MWRLLIPSFLFVSGFGRGFGVFFLLEGFFKQCTVTVLSTGKPVLMLLLILQFLMLLSEVSQCKSSYLRCTVLYSIHIWPMFFTSNLGYAFSGIYLASCRNLILHLVSLISLHSQSSLSTL